MEEAKTISKAHAFELLRNTLGKLKMSSDFYGDFLGTKINDDSAKRLRADFKLKNTSRVSKRKSNIPDEQPLLVTGGILKQYQLDGFEWMATLWENGINGILADETVLDKTTQVIALFCHLYEMGISGPFLVIAPLSNVSHWFTELERLAPDVPCLMYRGNQHERMEMRSKMTEKTRVDELDVDMLHVVVISYDVAVEDTAAFSNIMWRTIVLEEGTGFKNISCRLIQELQLYNSSSRLFLDCGIIWNALIQPDNLSQLSSLLNWILPDIFDDLYLEKFQSWFGAIEMSDNVDEEHEQRNCILATLCQIFTPFLLRRKRRILTGIRRIKSKVDPDNSPMKEVKANQNLENNPEVKSQQESHLIDQEVQRMRSSAMSSPNPKDSPNEQVEDKVINMSSGLENKDDDNAKMKSTVFVAEPPTRAEVEALNETRSSSSLISLMNGMRLGKCSGESQNETGKVQERDRTVDSEKVEFAMECANCRKQIKKAKLSLVCPCKLEVYCTSKCQQSSSHKLTCKGAHKPAVAKIKVTNGGPSGEKVRALLVDIGGSPQELKMKAENGDPMAAYIIGSAFAKRRTCNRKACNESEKCPTMMPQEYLEKSILETDEIAIKWLEVAAKAGVPEAMFDLGMKLQSPTGLRTDRRAGHDWLVAAYGTGKMDHVMEALLSREFGGALAGEFLSFCDNWKSRRVDKNYMLFEAPNLALFLLATRLRELKEGVTATGEPLLVFHQIKEFLDDVGELKQKQESEPLMLYSEKKRITMGFCAARPGNRCFLKDRNEKNVEFVQGSETHQNPDYQLLVKIYFENPEGRLLQYMKTTYNDRTPHLISCKHLEEFRVVAGGGCEQCVLQAGERLRAVGHGVYSISLTEIIPNYGYAARYATEDGVIMQDFFKGYSKSEIKQVLQCLMSKPQDLHPLAVAENQNLFWPIVWYWGSVFNAIKDSCGQTTLEAIYHKLEHKFSFFKMDTPISAQAAFPIAADGERRIACGSETCPNLDHEVKFSLCAACKVRRYCGEDCQREDWPKHKVFCSKKRNV